MWSARTKSWTCACFVCTLTCFAEENSLPVDTRVARVDSSVRLRHSATRSLRLHDTVTYPVASFSATALTAIMTTLLTLPPEMQLIIANHVDEEDVLALNLTSRALRQLVRPVMASIFGSVRTFSLYPQGMASLLALSEDAICAPYVKTLIIIHDGTTDATMHSRVLIRALENFSAFKTLTTLCVRHNERRTSFAPNKRQAFSCIKDFVGEMLLLSKHAGLLVSTVMFEFEVPADISHWGVQRRAWTQPSREQDLFVTEVTEIFALGSVAGSGSPERATRVAESLPRLSTIPKSNSLVGQHLEADDWKLVLRWLPISTMLETVNLADCNIEYRAFQNLIINRHLKDLSIKDATLVRNLDMTGRWNFVNPNGFLSIQGWQEVLDGLLLHCQNLASCRLGQLGFHDRTYTGAIWEACSIGNVKELITNLRYGKRSRLVYKKQNAPDSGPRKPRKKAARTKKLRFTQKKASRNKK